jgi:3-phenylpropionate/trans-cinnamate dioxygenase ferredoxin component
VGDWIDVGVADEPADGTMRPVEAGGEAICLARVGGEWVAFADDCTHEECPLADGYLEGQVIECACHGSQFDVVTGEVLVGPATEPVAVFPIRVVDGRLEVEVR